MMRRIIRMAVSAFIGAVLAQLGGMRAYGMGQKYEAQETERQRQEQLRQAEEVRQREEAQIKQQKEDLADRMQQQQQDLKVKADQREEAIESRADAQQNRLEDWRSQQQEAVKQAYQEDRAELDAKAGEVRQDAQQRQARIKEEARQRQAQAAPRADGLEELSGTITAVNPSEGILTISDETQVPASGQVTGEIPSTASRRLSVDQRTAVLHGSQRLPLQELKAGDHVKVQFHPGSNTARTIMLHRTVSPGN